jgi:hypothetical protein
MENSPVVSGGNTGGSGNNINVKIRSIKAKKALTQK